MNPAPAGSAAVVACPLCQGEGRRLFEKNGIWIADCYSCGHRYSDYVPPVDHVQKTYDDAYFLEGGAGYPDYLAMSALMQERGTYYAGVLRREGLVTGRVCDIGAASGSLLQGLAKEGYHCVGVEPNAKMVQAGQRASGLDLRQASLETFSPHAGELFDCLLLLQVIAHLVTPAQAVELARRVLRSGGLVIVETWDRRSLTARCAGRRWHEYSPPSVLQFFDRRSLDALFVSQGFAVVAHGRPPKPMQGAHFRSALRNALGESLAVRALTGLVPDGARIPYPGDDVFWVMFRWMGQQATE